MVDPLTEVLNILVCELPEGPARERALGLVDSLTGTALRKHQLIHPDLDVDVERLCWTCGEHLNRDAGGSGPVECRDCYEKAHIDCEKHGWQRAREATRIGMQQGATRMCTVCWKEFVDA